jgi:uncharacterized protein involved in exopolysaccharide biosynthesis
MGARGINGGFRMDLSDHFRMQCSHWVIILAVTMITGGAAFRWSTMQPRAFSAATTGIVAASGSDGSTGGELVGY